jgi:hypothetical protein
MFLGGSVVAISGVMYIPGWLSGGDQWRDVCSWVVEWGAISGVMYVPGWLSGGDQRCDVCSWVVEWWGSVA